MTITPITNTVIVGATREQLETDIFFDSLTSQLEDQIPTTESVEYIKLPSLHRILIICRSHLTSQRVHDHLRLQHHHHVTYSIVDTRIPEATFLALPDPGKKYVISPPPSPPEGWIDRPEEGPNCKVIHNPQELTDLLFKRLGDRVGPYDDDDDIDDNDDDREIESNSNSTSSLQQMPASHEEFFNEKGELEVPKVLVERLNGNPIIVLDPPPNPTSSDGKNADGVSVNRIKTPRPPI